MQSTVFPAGIESLQQCTDLQQVSDWREQFCKTVYARKLGGDWDAILAFNPQDDNLKQNLTMPQRVYIAATQLVTEVDTVNTRLLKEQIAFE